MPPTLTPEDDRLLKRVQEAYTLAEPFHKRHRDRWGRMYQRYRFYSELKEAWREASPRGRDDILRDAAAHPFGSRLVIPYAFAAVETIIPRQLSHRPRGLVIPRSETAEANVENVRSLVELQQQRMLFMLKLQETAKSGQIYGLGVGGMGWRQEKRKRRVLGESEHDPNQFVPRESERIVYDDPFYEDIDIFDFMWDPYADEIQDGIPYGSACEFVIHRTWRNTNYVKARVESGDWRLPEGVTMEEVAGWGPQTKYDDLWRDRMAAAGHKNFETRSGHLHEVWQFHTGAEVITVLDNQAPVDSGPNPYWHGEIPFHVYRPSKDHKRLAGLGSVEPLEDLSAEMDALRSQRRDFAAASLNMPIAYAEGYVDPDQIRLGAASLIPVEGDPKELLFPIRLPEPPASGYREEDALKSDMERVIGLSEPSFGQTPTGNSTATEAQLVLASTQMRIQNSTWRLEQEVIKGVTHQQIALNQQKIVSNRKIPLPATPRPGSVPPERRWTWLEIGPRELAGEFEFEPEGGATQPKNEPADIQKAQTAWTMFGQNPMVDQRALIHYVMGKIGLDPPEAYIAPPEPQIPPDAIRLLVENQRLDPEDLQMAMAAVEENGQEPVAR